MFKKSELVLLTLRLHFYQIPALILGRCSVRFERGKCRLVWVWLRKSFKAIESNRFSHRWRQKCLRETIML